MREIRGAVDVNIEQEGPQPQLIIEPDRALCARYQVRIEDVNQLINTALGGEPVGTLYEGERRFDIVARFDRELLNSREAIERLPVQNQAGVPILLSQVARFDVVDGQTIIAREGAKRRMTVRLDIVGRDQGGFVAEAQRRFKEAQAPGPNGAPPLIQVPPGYTVRWLGMFENLERAGRHFSILIPVTIAVIFVILVMTFGSIREAFAVLLAVPFAFVGGTLALYIRGMHLNVSSGVGFATLFGVAIMDGVVLVQWVKALRQQGMDIDHAIVEGAKQRLRPILTTSLVAILGLLPASIATGLGSDVQRPLATVIVWGLVSSTVLTLFIVPLVYRVLAPKVDAAPAPDECAAPAP
jgi:cobalt-zinc-cadmium resistance protein CzcA